jgi:hypothetical protein
LLQERTLTSAKIGLYHRKLTGRCSPVGPTCRHQFPDKSHAFNASAAIHFLLVSSQLSDSGIRVIHFDDAVSR